MTGTCDASTAAASATGCHAFQPQEYYPFSPAASTELSSPRYTGAESSPKVASTYNATSAAVTPVFKPKCSHCSVDTTINGTCSKSYSLGSNWTVQPK